MVDGRALLRPPEQTQRDAFRLITRTDELVSQLLLIAALACWPLSSSAVSFTEELRIPEHTAAIVRIDELGVDFRVTVSLDGEQFDVDQPDGRTGSEVLALGPFANGKTVRLTLSPVDSVQAGRSDYAIGWTPVLADGQPLAAASLLMDGARATARSANRLRTNQPLQAREALELAVENYRKAADMAVADDGLSDYARFLVAVSQYQLFRLEEALVALALIPTESCFSDPFCYKQDLLKAEILFEQDDYAEAVDYYSSGLAKLAASKAPDRAKELDLADALAVLGFARVLTGGSRLEGKRELDTAVSIASRRNDSRTLGKAHNNLGGYYAVARDYRSAKEHLEQAASYFASTDDLRGHVYALGNLSQTHYYVGDFDAARRVSRQAVALAESGFDPSIKVSAYSILGRLYESLGDFEKAEQFARLSLAINESSSRRWRSYVSRAVVGTALRRKGSPQEALTYHLESLRFFEDHGPEERVTNLLNEIALDYLALGDYASAVSASEQAWSRRGGISGLIPSTELVSTRARALIAVGRYEQAIELLEETRNDYLRADHLVAAKIEVAHLLMLAYRSVGESATALSFGKEAADLILDVSGQLEFYRLGPAWASQSHRTVLEIVDLMLSEHERAPDFGHERSAFALLNRFRASNLMQQRQFATTAIDGSVDTSELASLRRQLAVVSHKRASSVASNEDEFRKLSVEYYRLLERYQNELAVQPIAAVPTGLSTVDELQRQIPEGAVVLQYVCVPDRHCYVFVLTSTDYHVKRLATEEAVRVATYRAAGAVRSRQWTGPGEQALKVLSRLLVADVLPAATQHIIAVSSFPISDIPLAVLDETPEAVRYSPLVESYAITLVPSVSALTRAGNAEDTRKAHEYTADLAIFADPLFSRSAVKAAATLSESVGTGLRNWADSLSRLPWSAREADEIRKLFSGRRVISYTGERATKENLLSDNTRGARAVHIASHAFFSERTPDLVGIAAAVETVDGSGGGGFVTLQELFAKPFRSELVVVAGCETGLGAVMQGEGMMSLGRGFMAQGVDQVVSTRWPVSDRASALFMSEFYRALASEGGSTTLALRSAQLKLRRQPRYAAPFYWAAYVLDTMSVSRATEDWHAEYHPAVSSPGL